MKIKTKLLAACAVLALAPAMPIAALAQDAGSEVEANEDASELEEIVVTGSFTGTGAESAMKMAVDVLDTPFSVAAYSEAFIDSLDTSTVSDLYNYMTGVKKAGNTAYDITLRGFKSAGEDRNAVMVDGMPGLAGRFGSPPTVGVERIEVVKGPMSVLYGQIQPGGFVNMIAKKPDFDEAYTFEVRASSFLGDRLDLFDANSYTISGDATGPVGDSEVLAYRLVAEYSDRESFRDYGYDTGLYVAPSLAWDITPDTKLTGIVEYRDSEASFDVGLAVPLRDMSLIAPITTRYSEPGDVRQETGLTASVFFTHRFNDWARFNTSYRSVDYESSQQEFSSVSVLQRPGSTNFVVNRRARELETERQYNYVDSNLFLEFATGPIDHKLLVGVNYGRDATRENRLRFVNSNCSGPVETQLCFDIDVNNPVYGLVPAFDSLPSTNPNLANQTNLLTDLSLDTESFGVYFSNLMSLGEHWKVSFGARNFRDETVITENRVAGVAPQSKVAERSFLPSVGLMYQPTDNVTIYASYAESYNPVSPNFKDANGNNPFVPVEGIQYEVGAKAEELLDGRLGATLSLFRIEQSNAINTFICPVGTPRAGDQCQNQVGEVVSEGIEFETDYSITDNWQILFGYAYIDARVTASTDPAELNRPIANTARNSANLWSRYDWSNGFGVGLGVVYTGERPAILPTGTGLSATPFELPAYTTVDLGLYYETGPYQFSLKGSNLFDETYYESAGQTAQVQVFPGAPRAITFSVRASF